MNAALRGVLCAASSDIAARDRLSTARAHPCRALADPAEGRPRRVATLCVSGEFPGPPRAAEGSTATPTKSGRRTSVLLHRTMENEILTGGMGRGFGTFRSSSGGNGRASRDRGSFQHKGSLDMDMRLERLQASAWRASRLLKAMSNQHRLMILCQLAIGGEKCVGELERIIGLSQSARCRSTLPGCAATSWSGRAVRPRPSTIRCRAARLTPSSTPCIGCTAKDTRPGPSRPTAPPRRSPPYPEPDRAWRGRALGSGHAGSPVRRAVKVRP